MADGQEGTVQHRLSAEGADPLLLAGVNDSHLLELSRVGGSRVVMRDDHLLLSGPLEDVERSVPVAQHMIHLADVAALFERPDQREPHERWGETPVAFVVPAVHRRIAPGESGRWYLSDVLLPAVAVTLAALAGRALFFETADRTLLFAQLSITFAITFTAACLAAGHIRRPLLKKFGRSASL